ncbi:hypothetical protein [Mesorhizobium sp.]|uniref:hypothetical protein n=1 Tax=Mesorhizobium sp. TaxID=1871066 RepID=UPI00257C7E8D|nr:hypothetical protein [Mesorhizobium sp.]
MGAYSGATDSGVLFQKAFKKSGGEIDLKRVSGDRYWLKTSFCALHWGNCPTADLQLSQTFFEAHAWHDTHNDNPEFDRLMVDARVALDENKRNGMYAECQALLSQETDMACFAIRDQMDGATTQLRGLAPQARYDMNDQRLAEKGWFA